MCRASGVRCRHRDCRYHKIHIVIHDDDVPILNVIRGTCAVFQSCAAIYTVWAIRPTATASGACKTENAFGGKIKTHSARDQK